MDFINIFQNFADYSGVLAKFKKWINFSVHFMTFMISMV